MPQPSVNKNILIKKLLKLISFLECYLCQTENFDLENVSDLDPLPSPQAELELPSPVCRPDEPSPTVDTPYETAFKK